MDKIIELAKKNIDIERSKYQHFLDEAKKFAISNELFVLDEDLNHFYAINAFKKSCELADIFFKLDATLGRYTKVVTKIKYHEFGISVDERELIKMTNISYNLSKVVKPVYKYDLLFLGNDILNVAILEKLCSPLYYKEWNDLKINECNFDLIGINADLKASVENISTVKSEIIKTLFDKFVVNSEYVVIGSIAITGFIGHRIQIITPNDFEDDIRKLSSIIRFSYDIIDIKFITNSRLKRMTVYINNHSVMDIFNCAQYEVVPYYEKKNIKIGSKYVLMRFRLIDFWSVKVLLNDNRIDLSYAKSLISIIKSEYNKIKDDDIVEYKYIGKIINFDLSVKRNNTDIIMPYYPLKQLYNS